MDWQIEQAIGIYVHIPFCVKKCDYCDFLSFPAGKKEQLAYVKILREEIRQTALLFGKCAVSSVFFGGGTPSVLPAPLLCGLLEEIFLSFSVEPDAEISLEVNPESADAKAFAAYREAGWNRMSIGCQSMHNEELKKLGRVHTHADFLRAFRMARDAGFPNLNIDLMSAIPGSSFKSWEESLTLAAALRPEHISAYSLILEEGTPFYGRKLDLPDEETERMMYERTAEILAGYGYAQYEISNYALPGFACRHNIGYWKQIPYLGFGLGAASYIAPFRYKNPETLPEYKQMTEQIKAEDSFGVFLSGKEELLQQSREDEMAEYMILRLRMNEGIRDTDFRRRFGCSVVHAYGQIVQKYVKNGLLISEEQGGDQRIHLSRRGISLSNLVMAEFLP